MNARYDDIPGSNTQDSAPSDHRLLFSTDHGWVRHCTCRDVLVLSFAEHWMALTRPQYRDFHLRLIAAVRCPIGQMQLNSGGRFAFRRNTNEGATSAPAFTLDLAGMEELLWLLDSARFMLEAREAARDGYEGRTSPRGIEDKHQSH
jgi:hypothetical protein